MLSAAVSWTRLSNFEAFVVFLNSGSVTRRLASLRWLQPGTVRQLPRYNQDALTSCRPSHRASLPPLGGTSGALVVFAPRRTSAPPRPGVGHPVAPAGNGAEETTGSPKFLGNLHCPFARVLTDAGRTARTRPLRCSSMAPGPPGAKAPTKGLSTPNSMAFGLAVYASQGGSLQPHARLASGCWSGSTGWAFHPQDSAERFQICFLHLILLSQALLGAMGATVPERVCQAIAVSIGVTAYG